MAAPRPDLERAWDAFVDGESAWLVPAAGGLGEGQGRERLAGPPPARRRGPGRRRPGPPPAPRSAPVGVRVRPARPRPGVVGRRLHRAVHGAREERPPRRAPVSHLRIDPEVERHAGPDEADAVADGAARRGLAARPARSSRHPRAPSTCAPTRRPCGATCARSGASTSNKARTGGVRVVARRSGAARRVLPDLPRDGGPGRVPHPRAVRLPGRLGGLRAATAAPACCSRSSPDGDPGRDAVPRAGGAAGRGALRRA